MVADALTKVMSSAALSASCSAKKAKRSHVQFATMAASAATASAQHAVCVASDHVRRVEDAAFFEQIMFAVGGATTIATIVCGMFRLFLRRPPCLTAPNHTSFTGDTDEYREYLREYGRGYPR